MTTYAETPTRTTSSWPTYAALGAGLALVLTAIGTFGDRAADGTAKHGWEEYAVVVAIIALATALVFGLVVRSATPANAGTRAIVLAVLSVVSILVFWTGLPPVLAFGAIACAMKSRSGLAKAAMVLAGISIVGAGVLAVIG
jgi:hypothetical protein